ncbi:interferon-inducible GTPase 5-like isoform X1 [Gopherus flavomarginatus]|uniref:interferon-inducible GTPase 5-like isoform X1 n=1 Tax=Gopherus flavomarginatus TaxID=286002 RepID=UPI0021CC1BDA|nr:interferon-inducible GTPase 5-like isoform X1 [Gopherus flavomarginatus]
MSTLSPPDSMVTFRAGCPPGNTLRGGTYLGPALSLPYYPPQPARARGEALPCFLSQLLLSLSLARDRAGARATGESRGHRQRQAEEALARGGGAGRKRGSEEPTDGERAAETLRARQGLSTMALDGFRTAIRHGNLTEAISIVQQRTPQWFNSHTLSIAVTGESGSGKSSLINAMLGRHAGDEGAAETGMLDTMMEPMAYPDPFLPGITFWDMPGMGTAYFPLNTYCEQLNLSRFDFFIIVGSQRFRSEHARLVCEIQRMGKRFYFVRSKADMDLDASRRQRPSSYNEERILEQIREDCRGGIAAEGVDHPKVFVVSSWEPNRYDFPLLRQTLQTELLHLKRDAFLLSLTAVASPIINEKKATLKGEIWKTALFSCLLAVIPIPGLAFLCTFFSFKKHLFQYYSSFGVDDRALSALARQVGNPVWELTAVMTSLGTTPMTALKLLADSVGAAVMVAEYSWKRLPVFGAMVSGGVALVTTYFMLRKCLASVADDTQRVLSKALEAEREKAI